MVGKMKTGQIAGGAVSATGLSVMGLFLGILALGWWYAYRFELSGLKP